MNSLFPVLNRILLIWHFTKILRFCNFSREVVVMEVITEIRFSLTAVSFKFVDLYLFRDNSLKARNFSSLKLRLEICE